MSPETPTRAPVGLEDALARVLDCPLNERAWADAARNALAAMDPPPTLDAFSAERPLPRLSAVFDAEFYLARNPDVAEAGMEPYRHFIEHGIGEGRDPHPLVDLAHLRAGRDDEAGGALDAEALASALADPAVAPHPLFDAAAYLEHNPDVREAGLPPLQHYIRHGAEEGRRPNPAFDPDWYCERYLAPGAGRYEAFVHFVQVGQARGNAPSREVAGQDAPGDGANPVAEARPAGEGPGEAPGEAALQPPAGEGVEAPPEAGVDPAPVEGFLDAVHGRMAHGWAWSPGEPGRTLAIEIIDEGGVVVGSGAAGIFREDLEAHGFGDGCHAFQLRIARGLDDGQPHTLSARVAGSGQRLQGEVAYRGDPAPAGEYDRLTGAQVREAAHRISETCQPGDRRAFLETADRSRLLLETEDFEAALAAVEAAMRRFPGNALLPLQAAEACIGLGRPDLAVTHCRRAVESAGEGGLAATSWLHFGNANRMLGQWHEAEAAFSRALRHDPRMEAARRRLAEVGDRNQMLEARRCLAEGDRDGALRRLVPQLVRRPDDEGLQRLVHKAMGQAAPAATSLDADARRALESVQLLRAVVEHVQVHGGDA